VELLAATCAVVVVVVVVVSSKYLFLKVPTLFQTVSREDIPDGSVSNVTVPTLSP